LIQPKLGAFSWQGVVYDRLEVFDKAVESYSDVLKSWRKLWGPDHVELADVLNSLGNAYRKQSEPQKALRCYEECLRIRLIAGDEIQVANTKNNIGAVLATLDEKMRAKAFYAHALRLKNDVLGQFHVETARTIYNIGQLFAEEKKFDQGLRFFHESKLWRVTSSCNSNTHSPFYRLACFQSKRRGQ
jgi:tetratricopeptide (TPR) repeat protein